MYLFFNYWNKNIMNTIKSVYFYLFYVILKIILITPPYMLNKNKHFCRWHISQYLNVST